MDGALRTLESRLGREDTKRLLDRFALEFPGRTARPETRLARLEELHPHPRRERERGDRPVAGARRRSSAGTRDTIPRRDRRAGGRLRRRAAVRAGRPVAHRAPARAGTPRPDLARRAAALHPRALGGPAGRRARGAHRADGPGPRRHRGGGARAPPAVRWRRTQRRARRRSSASAGRAGGVLVGLGVDATRGPDRQEHLRLARPAVPRARPRHPDARRDPGRGARHARRLGRHRAVADRPLGAVGGVRADQADARQRRGGRLGLLARRLPDRRRPRRRGRVRQAPRPGLGARHPARERHGAQPHGHRFALGHRPPRVVPLARPTRPIRRTRSTARTCPRTNGSGSCSRTTTGTTATPRSSSSGSIG